jgi:alpha-tubulin suppressor-like RCC1 family protein
MNFIPPKETLLKVKRWRKETIAAGRRHTVGLKSNGTVVAVGDNKIGQCNVSGWHDIVAVAAGDWHTIGLKLDSTLIAVGNNRYLQCNVSGWRGIVAIAAGVIIPSVLNQTVLW